MKGMGKSCPFPDIGSTWSNRDARKQAKKDPAYKKLMATKAVIPKKFLDDYSRLKDGSVVTYETVPLGSLWFNSDRQFTDYNAGFCFSGDLDLAWDKDATVFYFERGSKDMFYHHPNMSKNGVAWIGRSIPHGKTRFLGYTTVGDLKEFFKRVKTGVDESDEAWFDRKAIGNRTTRWDGVDLTNYAHLNPPKGSPLRVRSREEYCDDVSRLTSANQRSYDRINEACAEGAKKVWGIAEGQHGYIELKDSIWVFSADSFPNMFRGSGVKKTNKVAVSFFYPEKYDKGEKYPSFPFRSVALQFTIIRTSCPPITFRGLMRKKEGIGVEQLRDEKWRRWGGYKGIGKADNLLPKLDLANIISKNYGLLNHVEVEGITDYLPYDIQ
jgi:hypothetical protein